ncbi:MAG TPA: VanZ family protein [Gemmatimonadaceae bacterium]|nr:VanZ family protein [Gemmatimonadaceae bacterium]
MKIAPRSTSLLNSAAIVAILAAILVVTLLPTGTAPPSPFSGFAIGRRHVGDAILNFCLFVPLGVAIGWNGRATVFAGIFGLLAATLIELLQMIVPGRDPALSDILLNGAGTLAGAVIARRRQAWMRPSATALATLTAGSLSVATLMMAATAYLLFPVPGTPARGSRYLALPSSPGDAAADIRSLISIQLPFAPEPVLVARSGNDVLLRYPSRGSSYGFDQPEYWGVGAFDRRASGERMLVRVSREGARWDIAVGLERARLGPTVGQGWATLAYPDAIGRRWGALLNGLWLFALCFPAGFWARGALRIVSLVIIAALLAVLPAVTGIVSTGSNEWAGALMGFAGGVALAELGRRWVSRRRA